MEMHQNVWKYPKNWSIGLDSYILDSFDAKTDSRFIAAQFKTVKDCHPVLYTYWLKAKAIATIVMSLCTGMEFVTRLK